LRRTSCAGLNLATLMLSEKSLTSRPQSNRDSVNEWFALWSPREGSHCDWIAAVGSAPNSGRREAQVQNRNVIILPKGLRSPHD
jgi:hypothetical protein